MHRLHLASSFASLLLVAACCSAQPAPAGPPPDATPVEPKVVTPTPTNDCTPPPPRACCRAMTDECLQCVADAKAERAAFVARCPGVLPEPTPTPEDGGAGPATPPRREVVGVDCRQRPEPMMCCMAETPDCIACTERVERLERNWQATCGPAGFAPPDVTYDCSRPAPTTPCCRALLPECTKCVDTNRQIAEEYARACPPKAP